MMAVLFDMDIDFLCGEVLIPLQQDHFCVVGDDHGKDAMVDCRDIFRCLGGGSGFCRSECSCTNQAGRILDQQQGVGNSTFLGWLCHDIPEMKNSTVVFVRNWGLGMVVGVIHILFQSRYDYELRLNLPHVVHLSTMQTRFMKRQKGPCDRFPAHFN